MAGSVAPRQCTGGANKMVDERRVVGWRVKVLPKGWIFFSDQQRASSLADERNAILQECHNDGTVQTIRHADWHSVEVRDRNLTGSEIVPK
jgi:hypothetical protein